MYKHITNVGKHKVIDGSTLVTPDATGHVTLSLAQMMKYERRAAKTVLLDVPSVEGDVLKFARKAIGLTQTEMAAILGVQAETISRWETGKESFKRAVQLAFATLINLAEAHGVEALKAVSEMRQPEDGEALEVRDDPPSKVA